MKLTFRIFTVFSMIVFTLASAVNAQADTVTDWNRIAVQEVVIAVRPGASGALDVAVVQLAVYDAVQAIAGEYQPYHVVIQAPQAQHLPPRQRPRAMSWSTAFPAGLQPSKRSINSI